MIFRTSAIEDGPLNVILLFYLQLSMSLILYGMKEIKEDSTTQRYIGKLLFLWSIQMSPRLEIVLRKWPLLQLETFKL